ncbi:MAG: NUDIX domain-containing protein [Planctomycetota bacterium]
MTRPPFEPVEGVEGAFVWTPGERALRVEVDADAPPPESTPEIDAAWDAMRRSNPRLHDAVFLSAIAIDADAGAIRCVPDRYRRLATLGADGIDTPEPTPVLTSVIGLLVATDEAGEPHTLIGRRAADTRLFGGQWESAPAGGLDPDLASEEHTLSAAHLLEQIRRELTEETGLTLHMPVLESRTVCVVWTPEARSYDIAVLVVPSERIEAIHPAEHARSWEYDDVQWLPLGGIKSFDRVHGPEMTPQLRVVWRVMGWV